MTIQIIQTAEKEVILFLLYYTMSDFNHLDSKTLFKCPKNNCDKVFIYHASFERHLKSHYQEIKKARPFQCHFCERSFIGKGFLDRHLILAHRRRNNRFKINNKSEASDDNNKVKHSNCSEAGDSISKNISESKEIAYLEEISKYAHTTKCELCGKYVAVKELDSHLSDHAKPKLLTQRDFIRKLPSFLNIKV